MVLENQTLIGPDAHRCPQGMAHVWVYRKTARRAPGDYRCSNCALLVTKAYLKAQTDLEVPVA